jgi:Hint module
MVRLVFVPAFVALAASVASAVVVRQSQCRGEGVRCIGAKGFPLVDFMGDGGCCDGLVCAGKAADFGVVCTASDGTTGTATTGGVATTDIPPRATVGDAGTKAPATMGTTATGGNAGTEAQTTMGAAPGGGTTVMANTGTSSTGAVGGSAKPTGAGTTSTAAEGGTVAANGADTPAVTTDEAASSGVGGVTANGTASATDEAGAVATTSDAPGASASGDPGASASGDPGASASGDPGASASGDPGSIASGDLAASASDDSAAATSDGPAAATSDGPAPTDEVAVVSPIVRASIAPDVTPEVSNGSGGGSACFPGHETVELEDGSVVRMDAVAIGDMIKVGTGEYSRVFMFTHKMSDTIHEFVNVKTDSGASLSLTTGHYIYANGELVAASELSVGDELSLGNGAKTAVVSVGSVVSTGLFNPQTVNGNVVVNGIVASTYTTAVEPTFAHAILAPFRLLNLFGYDFTALESGGGFLTGIAPAGQAVF